MSPFDLMPEAILGVAGLMDDAGILIIALNAVFGALEMTPEDLEEILRDYWHGTGNPVEVVAKLYRLLSAGAKHLFEKLVRLFQRFWQNSSNEGSGPSAGHVPIS